MQMLSKTLLVFALSYATFGLPYAISKPSIKQNVLGESINTFSGTYYKGTNFNSLKVSNIETTAINYNWGSDTPYRAIGRNGFSIKWVGNFDFTKTTNYKFTATYDDGLRLYVDGTLIIDDWKTGNSRTSTQVIALTSGSHEIKVDYFENMGNANVALSWAEDTIAPPPPPSGNCWPTALPVGAIAGQPAPVFCNIANPSVNTAEEPTANSWLDSFEHGTSFANISDTAYSIFENVDNQLYKTKHWLHNNHWMVDMAPDSEQNAGDSNGVGGSMLRPNKTFKFENGKLVVEIDYAAAIEAYETGAWGEIVVTTANQPTHLRNNGLYAYDMFPGHYSLGVRMQPDRHITAALMDNTTKGELEGGRVWEMSFFQHVGQTVFGGAPFNGLENYWRVCSGGDPDTFCRDRFRLELTQTALTVYVNGEKYFEQTGIPPLPNELVNGDVYVYIASITWNTPADTLRYHWDKFTVNPNTPPSAAPGFGDSPEMLMQMSH